MCKKLHNSCSTLAPWGCCCCLGLDEKRGLKGLAGCDCRGGLGGVCACVLSGMRTLPCVWGGALLPPFDTTLARGHRIPLSPTKGTSVPQSKGRPSPCRNNHPQAQTTQSSRTSAHRTHDNYTTHITSLACPPWRAPRANPQDAVPPPRIDDTHPSPQPNLHMPTAAAHPSQTPSPSTSDYSHPVSTPRCALPTPIASLPCSAARCLVERRGPQGTIDDCSSSGSEAAGGHGCCFAVLFDWEESCAPPVGGGGQEGGKGECG